MKRFKKYKRNVYIMGKRKSNFFDRIGKKLDITSNKSFLRDISKDATFKKISGSATGLITTTTDGLSGIIKGVSGSLKSIGGVFSGNMIYIILGLGGIAVVGYTYSKINKK